MSEPVSERLNMRNLTVDIADVSPATGFRELADHLDALEVDYMVHSVTYHSAQFQWESPIFSVLVELFAEPEDQQAARYGS